MSDEAISGLTARTWIFTGDCFAPKCGARNDKKIIPAFSHETLCARRGVAGR